MGDDVAIYQSLEDCVTSIREIARRSKCSINKVERILRNLKLTATDLKIIAIKKQLDKGIDKADEISDIIGLSRQTIIKYAKKEHLPIHDSLRTYRPVKRFPLVDLVVQEKIGLTLDHLGSLCSVTGERIRQYLHATEQYKLWKEGRELNPSECRIPSKKTTIIKQLCPVLEKIAIKKAKEKNWVYQKAALAYEQTAKGYRTSEEFKKLLSLFKYCKKAIDDDEEINITDACEALKTHPEKIRRALWAAGLEQYACLKYRRTREEMKNAK